MFNIDYELAALGAALLLVAGLGGYVTFVQQPAELERLEKAAKVEKMKKAELASLVAEYSSSKQEAEATISKWRSRYKVIPDTLSSPEVVSYLSELTQHGFESFDVSLSGIERSDDHSAYAVQAHGRSSFGRLYDLIWRLENSRRFYNVRDLNLSHLDLVTEDKETGRKKMEVMVSFDLGIDAYFGGPESASAGSGTPLGTGENVLPERMPDDLPPVPQGVLADAQPDANPFYPGVLEQVPPNTRGLIDVEQAEFVSIVDGNAIFRDEQGYRKAGVGDDVYLGQITSVDPVRGQATARLNRGGLLDRVELSLSEAEQAYRQAIGPDELNPAESRFEENAAPGAEKKDAAPKDLME